MSTEDTLNPEFVFDPVLYSYEENQFLLEALGKPTVVALKSLPEHVNASAVKPILARVNELEQLRQHEQQEWVGIPALKEAITAYLREDAKWARDHKRSRNAPRFPSLYSYDAKGRPHRSGPGSDNGRVRTYFGPAGERIPFAVQLIPDHMLDWQAPGMAGGDEITDKFLHVDATTNRIECRVPVNGSICGHTESYKAESRASYSAARARMSKHLRTATENVEEHREAHTNEFTSGQVA